MYGFSYIRTVSGRPKSQRIFRRPMSVISLMKLKQLTALSLRTAADLLDPDRRADNQDIEHAKAQLRKLKKRGLHEIRHYSHDLVGFAEKALHPIWTQEIPDDDAALKAKVETILFQPADAPKGLVSVNVDEGIVYLRGQLVSAAVINDLEQRARKIPGVRGVVNLLHLPGSEPLDSNDVSPHPLIS